MIKRDDILYFETFLPFPELVHGFSTNFLGDMRYTHDESKQSIQQFSEALGISSNSLVTMDQVHGNTVAEVTDTDWGFLIPETDGLLTTLLNVFLGVITADCLPLFFYDPQQRISAAVHAGWRGLYAEIIPVVVDKMREKGSNPEDILVGIGPSIRVCCYEVDRKFIDKFYKKFEIVERVIEIRGGKFFFDLQQVAKHQLQESGILLENIEDGNYCTSDHEDVYSARRDGKNHGEIMGIIGRRE